MMKTVVAPTLLLLAGALTLPAQNPTTTSASAPLVVKTTHEGIAQTILMAMESAEELPALGAGQHYLLTMNNDRTFTVQASEGATKVLHLVARPPALMKMFQAEIDESRPMMEAMAGMSMQQSGGDPADAEAMIAALFEFPQMIDTLTFVLDGDIEMPQNGMAVDLDLQPVSGTPFARFASTMKPNPLGAPVLAGKSVMDVRMAFTKEGFAAIWKPMLDFSARMMAGANGEDATKEVIAWSTRMYEAFDGTGALSVDLSKGLVGGLFGLVEGSNIGEDLAKPETWKLIQKAMMADPEIKMTMKANAMDVGGVKVHRLDIDMGDSALEMPPMMLTDGKMATYFAVTPRYYVMSMLSGAEAGMKGMLESTATDATKRAPLPGNALLTFTMDIHGFAESIGEHADEDVPKSFQLSLAPKGPGLQLKVNLK
jgi:hypothetical protein